MLQLLTTESTKINDLCHNKLCFVCLLYMGVLQRDHMPKLCFVFYCIWVCYSGILCQNCVLFVYCIWVCYSGTLCQNCVLFVIVYGCVTAGSYAKIVFCLLLYMGVLQRDPMPKLCFVKVLTSCKDFLQIVRIFFCHDLTDMSCPRLTPLV